MISKELLREELLNDVIKMLVEYDSYVIDKYHTEARYHDIITKGTPFEPIKKPDNNSLEHWKYRTNPVINMMANKIVGYIIEKVKG